MKIRAFGCPETFLAHTKADLLKNEDVNSLRRSASFMD